MNEILINRVAERYGVDKLDAMKIIERHMLLGKTDELMIITGLKGTAYDVSAI